MAKINKGMGEIPLHITRIVAGSGVSDAPLALRTVLEPQQEFWIKDRSVHNGRTSIRALLSNFGQPARDGEEGIPPLQKGYPLRQIGFYAKDPDEGEILFRIMQFDNPNWIPALHEQGFNFEPTFNFGTGNASEVTIHVNDMGLATISDIENRITTLERTLTQTFTQTLQTHLLDSIFSENGVHGLRYFKGRLQVRINNEWQVVGVLDNDNIGTGSNLLHFNGAALFDGVHRFNGEVSASEVISNEE